MPVLLAALCLSAASPGCLALNASGEPAGRPEGVTSIRLCPRCLMEAGESHVCWVRPRSGGEVFSRVCPVCGKEAGLYHSCGRTQLCPSCGQDASSGHVCGKTRYCRSCGREVEGVHAHEPGDVPAPSAPAPDRPGGE